MRDANKKKLILSLVVCALVVGINFFSDKSLARPIFWQGEPTSEEVGSLASALPARIKIPSVDVDAHIQHTGITKSGDMAVTENYTDVGWYRYGPRPGEMGTAVIAGHYDGKDTPRAVFFDLDKLKKGDMVEVIDEEGNSLKFKVTKTKVYDYDDSPEEVFNTKSKKPTLNLITCAGDWLPSDKMYNKRVVVFTELADI